MGVVVLIVVGPNNLPQFARSAGRLYGQIRRTADEMRRSLVLEADRQDAEKRYEEMLARRERAEEERRKAREAQPGVEAQQESLPGAPAVALADSEAPPDSPHAPSDGADDEFDAFLADPHGPYGAGRSVDEVLADQAAPPALDASTAGHAMTGQALPAGVTAEEWAELPQHIRELLLQRSPGEHG